MHTYTHTPTPIFPRCLHCFKDVRWDDTSEPLSAGQRAHEKGCQMMCTCSSERTYCTSAYALTGRCEDMFRWQFLHLTRARNSGSIVPLGVKVCEPDSPRYTCYLLRPRLKEGGQYIFLNGEVGPSISIRNGQNRSFGVHFNLLLGLLNALPHLFLPSSRVNKKCLCRSKGFCIWVKKKNKLLRILCILSDRKICTRNLWRFSVRLCMLLPVQVQRRLRAAELTGSWGLRSGRLQLCGPHATPG